MRILSTLMGLWAAFLALPAMAQETIGKPSDAGLNFQPATTELARDIQGLDTFINYIIFAIVIFVAVLLVIWVSAGWPLGPGVAVAYP